MKEKGMDAAYKAMRMISKMIQEELDAPEEVRVDFALIDKTQDIRDLLGEVTKSACTNHEDFEAKKNLLEYLTLVESGIVIFAQENGLMEGK